MKKIFSDEKKIEKNYKKVKGIFGAEKSRP